MDERLQRQSDLFISNRIAMKNGFLWDYPAIHGVSAVIWAAYQRDVDIEKIRYCKKELKKEAEAFGYLEDNASALAAAMLAISDDMTYTLRCLKKLYKMMLADGFKPSSSLMLTALVMIRLHDEKDFGKLVKKAKRICISLHSVPWHSIVDNNKTQEAHMILERETQEIYQREKRYRRLLKDQFPSQKVEGYLSDVLIMDHRSEEKNVSHLLGIYSTVKGSSEREYLEQDFEYALLAVLALVTKDPAETMSRVFEVYDYLEASSELKKHVWQKHWLFCYASLIVAMTDIDRVRYSRYSAEYDGDIFMAISMLPLLGLAGQR